MDTLEQLKAQFPALLKDTCDDERTYKDFYLWVFDYAKEGGKTVGTRLPSCGAVWAW